MHRRSVIFSVVWVWLMGGAALAGGPQVITLPSGADTLIVPADSPVRFKDFGSNEDEVAELSGKVLVTGTYYLGDNQYNDGPDYDLTLYLVPDPAIAARLPYYKRRGRAPVIYVTNAKAFADAVMSKTALTNLMKDRKRVATGHIALWVDQFTSDLECDSPNDAARFVALDERHVAVALGDAPAFPC